MKVQLGGGVRTLRLLLAVGTTLSARGFDRQRVATQRRLGQARRDGKDLRSV